ncbi:MAG TPA: MerR family transcriptional regulator [Bacteroidales bacterium]|nr:MerR family transcriptional regulator [Bacteroidales bacterium]
MEEGINVFSIKDLENFSGIKAHTIRIWEKRYGILDPERTDTNIRTYNESELKKILNVAYLNRNGLKISKIARLSEDELTQKVMTVSSSKDRSDQDFQPGKVLMSAIRFDEGLFIRTLEPFIRARGIEQAYCLYLHPLLLKARILWQTGSLSRAQEQFIRNVIRQIITVEESRLKGGDEKTRHAVAMINTSDNLCENNFLFYKYVLKKKGFDVIYTGDILPASEVVEMFRIKPFDFLVVNSSGFDFARKKIGYFSNIARSLMIRKIILTDFPGKNDQKLNDRILVASDPSEFIKCIDNLD